MKFFAGILILLVPNVVLNAQLETFSIKLAPFSTQKYDEFSPVFFQNGIVYCSNKKSFGLLTYSTNDEKGTLKIYYTDTVSPESSQNSKLLSKELSTNYNDGPVTFNKNQNEIYFSRNIESGKQMKDNKGLRNKLGIFRAVFADGKWDKVTEFRFNNEYYNITTPFLSPDGNRLFYASDKPGGYGGYDLYYSEKKNNYWGEPVNLGPMINSKGNEVYPFITESGGLLFSSDGHGGKGGKDIFFSKYADSLWLLPVPLDPPINSKYDDFGILTDANLDKGYFSSNRAGSIDIYSFSKKFPQKLYCDYQIKNQYFYSFKDDGSINLKNSQLYLEWDFGDGTVGKGNNVDHYFPAAGKYRVKEHIVDKKTNKVLYTKLIEDLAISEYEKPSIESVDKINAGETITFKGTFPQNEKYEIKSYAWSFSDGNREFGNTIHRSFEGKGIIEVTLILTLKNIHSQAITESCITKKLNLFKDDIEKESYLARLNRTDTKDIDLKYFANANENIIYSASNEIKKEAVFQLEIASSRKRIDMTSPLFSKVMSKYPVREVFQPSDSTYSYVVNEESNLIDIYPSFLDMTSLGYQKSRVRTYIFDNGAGKELYSLKKVFGIFSDVFFEKNDYHATLGTYPVLDQIVEIMNNHPEIKLEIAAYSDDDGSYSINMDLSQKRADAMANYIISKGVSKSRLIPKGYGNQRPLAQYSTEEDKKANRRVQFIIINN